MPREFARKSRPIAEVEHWIATEFRQFLLYTGPITLGGIVTDKIFDHFMVLNVAISVLLLSKSDLRNEYVQYTREILVYFIREAAFIYGDAFITYNVHGLSHIADDVVFFNIFNSSVKFRKFGKSSQRKFTESFPQPPVPFWT
jgi:hypothetical protein